MSVVPEFVYCPQQDDGKRCGALAEIIRRAIFESTDGPIEHVLTRCVGPDRHIMGLMPLGALAIEEPNVQTWPDAA